MLRPFLARCFIPQILPVRFCRVVEGKDVCKRRVKGEGEGEGRVKVSILFTGLDDQLSLWIAFFITYDYILGRNCKMTR